jgi:hypothetical protein
MPKPISELSDRELSLLAAGFPAVDELSDDQLLGVAAQQGYLGDEEATKLAVETKQKARAPIAEAISDVMAPAVPGGSAIVKALLTQGGAVGDVAAGIIPAVGGSILGGAVTAPSGPGALVGLSAGGAAGSGLGEGLVQARQYFRGERDQVGEGRLLGAIGAGAVPMGPQTAKMAANVVRRGVQGAGISTAAELLGQLVDEKDVNLGRLATTGALGFIFGAAAGTAESMALRRAVLKQVRATPEFKGFKGTDAELVDAVRNKIASEKPEPKNVTPAAEQPVATTPDAAAPEAPIVPAQSAEQEFSQRAGLPPRVPAPEAPPAASNQTEPANPDPVPPAAAAPPITEVPDEQLVALAKQAEAPEAPPEPTTIIEPQLHPVRDLEINGIVVNKDVPQFKGSGDTKTGVVEPLQGSYQRLGTAPIVVWEKANGEKEVITGRHRLDLARRTGEKTIPAQVVKESDGFTKAMALTFDAESNIRDGQGEIKDYAHYFRINPTYTKEAAQSRGLLRGVKANSGWHLGKDATDGLFSLYANDQIPEGKAVAIARGAPGNVPAQDSGIRAAKTKSAAELELYVRNLGQLTSKAGSGDQLGFAGVDTSFADFEREAAAISKVQADLISQKRDLVLAAQGAARRPEAARKMGLPVDDPAALQARIDQLQGEIERYQAPDAATFNELRRAAGLPVADEPAPEPPAVPPEDPNQGAMFEETNEYAAAHTRYLQLRALEKEGKLTAAGQAELDDVEKGLGQDFLDFYSTEKSGRPTSLGDEETLRKAEMQRRAAAPIKAADLATQVDLFGPTTDNEGQFSLFERTVKSYLNARSVTNPVTRSAVRGIIAGVWERKLARQLELDLATDAALAKAFDAPPAGDTDRGNQSGQFTHNLPRGQIGQTELLGVGRSVAPLPNANVGPQPGGIQLESRLYTQAFLADGFLAHTGRKFKSEAQLISAAQVLRNRNVETFWILPYDRDGRLLTPMALSSRLPNAVDLGADWEKRFQEHRAAVKWTTFDVLHNHPSGRPDPSRADLMFTRAIAEKFPKDFKRHYVINHGSYTVIYPTGDPFMGQVLPGYENKWDPTLAVQGSSPYLGREILKGDDPVRIGYELQVAERNLTVFFFGNRSMIVGTGSVNATDLAHPDFPKHLHELARGVGAVYLIGYYDGNQAVGDVARALQARGVINDLILTNGVGKALRWVNEAPHLDTIYGSQRARATRVAEEGQLPAETPPAPTHYVTSFDKTPVPQPLAQMHLVRPVEMPELVDLVKQLAGEIPKLRNLPRSRGFMRAAGRGMIVLDRRIFTDFAMANQTLAHEIGHLIDYLPDRTLKRGNLLGRLATLREYLAQSLPIDPNSPHSTLTPKERQQLRRQAEKQVGARPEKDEEADLAAWQQEVRKVYSELLQNALEARGLVVSRGRKVEGGADVVGAGDVGTELKNLSFWWRPIAAPDNPGYMNYRDSSVEIYADALSVLFNAPAEFRERAPTAWQMFFNYLDRKPEVKNELIGTWDLLHQGAKAVSAERLGNVRTGFARAEEILLAKAAERDARRNSLRVILERFKQKHFNIYAPIIERARQARAAGANLPWWQDPEFVFDAHPFSENANYRFLDRVQKTVLSPLEDLGIDDATLGDFLFFNRIAHESYLVGDQMAGRGTIANPMGHTPLTARRELLVMRYRMGPAQFEAMEQAARRFQDLALEVIERGHASGIYSDSQLALARVNRYKYATFAVVDFLEQSPHIPAAFKQQRGTLREVANPFLATAIKMLTANKFAELNQAKRVTVQLLTRHFPDEIDLAPVSKIPLANGKLMFRAKAPLPGKRELIVMDKGRPVSWHVDPEISDMFDRSDPASAHAIIGVTNWAFRNIFYPAFITYNPAFQLWANPIRDLSRSYVKLPDGVKRRHWIGEQLRAHRGARARLLNDLEGAELQRRRQLRSLAQRRKLTPEETAERRLLDDRALAIEILVQRGVTTPFESFASNPMQDDVWGKMLADYRLTPGSPEHGAALRKWVGQVPGLGAALDKIEFAGQTAEAMPKMGAYRVLTRELGWTPQQAAYFVRNHVGTPNFTKRGKWTVWDGTVFPFINIFMRGLEADVQQARGKIPGVPIDPRAQKFSYWRRMAERTLAPRLLQALAAAGVLGAGLKKYYDAWSDYDKANYLIMPMGTVHDGSSDFGYKSAGIRIPEDETAKLLGGVVHYLVQAAATGDDPAAKASLSNLVNFSGGMAPGINPVFTLASSWKDYADGVNPRDKLRGNPVLSSTQFQAGSWAALRGMIGYTWDQVGGGNFVRIDPNAKTWQEHLIGGAPVISRAIKITDAGLRERQRTLEATLDTRNAKIRLAMPDNVNRLLGEYYRLNAIQKENRTPVQAGRLAELSYWHSKVWQPNYEMMQDAKPSTWKAQGRAVGDVSKAFEHP